MKLLDQRINKIGVESLWEHLGKYYVSIKNRTYESTIEISEEKVKIWKGELGGTISSKSKRRS